MSAVESIPPWLRTRTGEPNSERFLAWVRSTQRKLLRAFPKGERAFCRIVDKLKSRLPASQKRHLHYTRQKYFMVSPEIVFFGDFLFKDWHVLVEIDGHSHLGDAAKEKDCWRDKIISDWKVTISRITNSHVLDGDFRHVEKWLIDRLYEACPVRGRRLRASYSRMTLQFPDIYADAGTLTTHRTK